MNVQKSNKIQACQALYLSIFDFILKHVLETKTGKADGLNRRLNWKVGVGKDNKNQILIKKQWIYSLAKVVIEEPEV